VVAVQLATATTTEPGQSVLGEERGVLMPPWGWPLPDRQYRPRGREGQSGGSDHRAAAARWRACQDYIGSMLGPFDPVLSYSGICIVPAVTADLRV